MLTNRPERIGAVSLGIWNAGSWSWWLTITPIVLEINRKVKRLTRLICLPCFACFGSILKGIMLRSYWGKRAFNFFWLFSKSILKIYLNFFESFHYIVWKETQRDDSMVKSMGHSSRGPVFNFQHSPGCIHLSVT